MNNKQTKNQPLLLCQNLHKHYTVGSEDLHILNNVNLTINQGQFISILGASGSGKSTLLHILGGFDTPNQGKVTFNGKQVFAYKGSSVDKYRSKHIGFVFQFYHLLPELTALENVIIPAMVGKSFFAWQKCKKETKLRAIQLLTDMNLQDRMNHKPAKLSGGERQRVAIARALINKPALLLTDEPTGNLDTKTGNQIMEIFHALHKQGQTIVFVTHDQNIANQTQKQVTLTNGKII